MSKLFKPGDRVRHAARPEWGPGSVESVSPVTHEGKPAEKLVIRFEHHGRCTVHTAFARIVPADSVQPLAAAPEPTEPGSTDEWLRELEGQPATLPLVTLPLPSTDALRPVATRLAATLDLYRFDGSARSITDWAIAQTGLSDPLQRFTREQMHDSFAHFRHNLDAHLRQLIRQLKRENNLAAAQTLARSHRLPAARQALTRALTAR